ncbi:MAG TPA: hypothetical protein VIF15_21670 [Polyangiaceae bacterium]|jgi:hypothetical protein
MTSTKNNRPSVTTRFTSVQTGIDKHVTGGATLGGVSYTSLALKAVFALAIAAINAAAALNKQWKDAVLAAHAEELKANALYALLRNYVIAQFGKQANAVLEDFGMSAPKPRGPMTAAAKAAAAAKREATRKVRNTLGSVQKKDVKGTIEVPVVAVTTVTPVVPSHPVTTAPASPAPEPASPPKPVA